ncbi:MAG: hypothetical protein ACLUO4_04615 [Christensenellales bacterium]
MKRRQWKNRALAAVLCLGLAAGAAVQRTQGAGPVNGAIRAEVCGPMRQHHAGDGGN